MQTSPSKPHEKPVVDGQDENPPSLSSAGESAEYVVLSLENRFESKNPFSLEDSLRESLWNLFVDFKKAGRLLTVKVDGEHALLTFRKAEDVEKALLFATGKSINGTRVKVEPYDASTAGRRVKRPSTDLLLS